MEEIVLLPENIGSVIVMVGVAQAVIGMVRKFGITGEKSLAISMLVTVAIVLIATYGFQYEPVKLVMESVLAVLAAAGYWRYRTGEPNELPPGDESSEVV